MATKIKSGNFSTDANQHIKLESPFGRFAAENYPTSADSATAPGASAIALGASANAGHANSTAIGIDAHTNDSSQVMLGGPSINSIRVGNSSYTPTDSADLVTKKYVDDNEIAGIDSAAAIALIDSDYIQSRETPSDSLLNALIFGG
jgi:hypothetical protein